MSIVLGAPLSRAAFLSFVPFVLFVVKKISHSLSSFFLHALSFFNKIRFTSYVLRPTSHVFKNLVPSPKTLVPIFILHPLSFSLPHAEPQSRRGVNKNSYNSCPSWTIHFGALHILTKNILSVFASLRETLFSVLHKISKPSLCLSASAREYKYSVFRVQYSVKENNPHRNALLPGLNSVSFVPSVVKKFLSFTKYIKSPLCLCASVREYKDSVEKKAGEPPALPGNRFMSYVLRPTSHVFRSLIPNFWNLVPKISPIQTLGNLR